MVGGSLRSSRLRARGKVARRGLATAGLATGLLVAASAGGDASTLTSVWHYNASATGVSSTFAPLGAAKLDVPPRPTVAVSEANGASSSKSDTLATLTAPAAGGTPSVTSSTLSVLASGAVGGATPNATAQATVENLNLALSSTTALGASAVKSSCASTKAGTTATSSIAGGTGALSAVALNPPPNTTIPLGIVTIVLNEQTVVPDVATGIYPAFEHDILVRAIHVIGNAPGAAGDVIVAESRCRLRGPGTP